MVYGWPLTLLKWIWEGFGLGAVPTSVTFYTLRTVMFLLSFVIQDWALHELLHDRRQRRIATILVASSYVTWTYQTHTFSNSAETLLVLWCLVLIQRIKEDEVCDPPPIFQFGMLTDFPEELTKSRILPSGISQRPGHIQPHHISSISRDTPIAACPACLDKVSTRSMLKTIKC